MAGNVIQGLNLWAKERVKGIGETHLNCSEFYDTQGNSHSLPEYVFSGTGPDEKLHTAVQAAIKIPEQDRMIFFLTLVDENGLEEDRSLWKFERMMAIVADIATKSHEEE